MAARALSGGGVLGRRAEVIGIGAGNEPTLFWLTTRVRRVFATDLYLADGWNESASAEMLTDPGQSWPGPWERQRLVVQHMDARELQHPSGSFDAAFSSSSFEDFGDHADVRRAVEEACRVVRPGGVISISTELRIAGDRPGLGGTLLFSREELARTVRRGAARCATRRRRRLVGQRGHRGECLAVRVLRSRRGSTRHGGRRAALPPARVWSRYPHVVLEDQATLDGVCTWRCGG